MSAKNPVEEALMNLHWTITVSATRTNSGFRAAIHGNGSLDICNETSGELRLTICAANRIYNFEQFENLTPVLNLEQDKHTQ